MSSQRTRRVESLLVREVSQILIREVNDPRVEDVTITGAKVSPDLRNATIFYQSRSTGAELESVEVGLESIRGVVKRIFGKRVRMKYLPDIRFRYDSSLEYAEHIEKLLKQVDTASGEEEDNHQKIKLVAQTLKQADRLVIASHVNPEADAIGSVMALGLALESMGKQPFLYNASGAPRNLLEFPGVEAISTHLPPWEPDVLAVLDCGDFDRIGSKAAEAFKDVGTIINIDHHATNDGFGHIKWVNPASSSAGELVVRLIDELGVEWTPEMANWILSAIVADTGSFRFANSRRETFYTAGDLAGRGARPEIVARRLFGNLPECNLRLLAMVLSTLEIHPEIKTAVVQATLDMFRETGAGHDALEGFVEHPRSVEGVEVAALIREIDKDKYKVSLRSKGLVDVGAIAGSFGGGGHSQAAGYSIEDRFEEVERKLLEALAGAYGSE